MIYTLIQRCRLAALRAPIAATLSAALLLPNLCGCAFFAQAMQAIPDVKAAAYKHLAGQTVAVVVWAEETGVRNEWPQIHLDTARMIQARIIRNQVEDKPAELLNTKFPISPASVVRFQDEHPELAAESMEDIAAKLGVSRVIYVEIRSFQTRSDASQDLFRGTITGSVNVIEITNGKGRVAFTDDSLNISYPKTSPEEGLPNLGDARMYGGTLEAFSTEIAKRFAPHADDRDAEYTTNSGPKQ